jgi:multisubunit Na+/H+ antiporter MnhB subunit
MRAKRAFTAAGALVLFVLLAQAVLDLGAVAVNLTAAVHDELHRSGVTHPVTAVLLNFRAYDTWLELIVLLVAAVAALEGRLQARPIMTRLTGDPLLATLVLLLVPLALLTGAYLLKAGAYAPGGAFQAGAVLAAGIVLLHLAGWETSALLSTSRLAGLLVAASAFFAAAGMIGLLLFGHLLQYAQGFEATTILVLEIAATVSIAAALALAVTGQLRRGEG